MITLLSGLHSGSRCSRDFSQSDRIVRRRRSRRAVLCMHTESAKQRGSKQHRFRPGSQSHVNSLLVIPTHCVSAGRFVVDSLASYRVLRSLRDDYQTNVSVATLVSIWATWKVGTSGVDSRVEGRERTIVPKLSPRLVVARMALWAHTSARPARCDSSKARRLDVRKPILSSIGTFLKLIKPPHEHELLGPFFSLVKWRVPDNERVISG